MRFAKQKNEPKVTIRQIAFFSGFSTATVSRVLNDKSTVDENTRRKILDAMKQLNYERSSSDANPESPSILVFISDTENPVMNLLIHGIKKTALSRGYRPVILHSTETNLTFGDYDYVMKNHYFAGIILISTAGNSRLLELLSLRCPIVMCSNYTEEKGVSFVSIDDRPSARKAVEYLISCGRKKIALFNYVPVMHFSRDRQQGYVDALEAAGMEINKDHMVILEQASCDLALSYALDILSHPGRPDAVFATSDLYAIGILRAAKKLGIRVPEDLAIIGFDDIPFAAMMDPPLTTIRQPFSDIGSRACELILEKIANHKAPKRRIILEGELIIRGSTPPPVHPNGTFKL